MNNYFFFDKENEVLDFLKKESLSNLFTEICVLIGVKMNKFVVKIVKNRSKDPSVLFYIDPYDYLNFINENELLLIFHSHLVGCEKPSEFDEKSSENCCYPFLIYSINSEKFFLYEPLLKDYDVNKIKRIKDLI